MYFDILLLGILTAYFLSIDAVMIKRECPVDELHKSCAFHDEYSCWEDKSKTSRIKTPPKRIMHCRSGCFCKKGWVRAYPHGPCIVAFKCKNRALREVLKKLPDGFNIY